MRIRTVLLALTVLALPVPAAHAATPGPGVLAYARLDGNIGTARLDGSGAATPILHGVAPVVSPDGSRIAFDRYTGNHPRLWVADADGSGQHALVLDSSGLGVSQVSWSPDGTRMVGVRESSPGVATVLVVFDAATGAVLGYLPNSGGETGPRWSPDGTLIASGSPAGQVLRRPDGSSRTVRAVSNGPWRADGRAFLAVRPGQGGLVSVDALTGFETSLQFLRESYGYSGAAWGADDSTYLAIDSRLPYQAGSQDIYRDGTVDVVRNAVGPSVGGLPVPADSDGPPPAVAGLAATTTPSTVHLSWRNPDPGAIPDFAGVEVRYALGATPPSTVTAGLDGGRLLTTSRDLDRLPPDTQVAVSVFSRDWTGHVGPAATAVLTTPHLTRSLLIAQAAPQDLVYGGRSVVNGQLVRDHDGAPIAGATLTVATRVYGSTGPFTVRGTVRTDAAGRYAVAQAPAIGYEYRIGYAGDADRAAATGDTTVRVARRVVNTLGGRVALTASTAPVLVAGKTYLQVLCGDHPCTLGPHNTDAAGRVVYSLTVPARGRSARYRVYVPGTPGYINGYGPWVTITGS